VLRAHPWLWTRFPDGDLAAMPDRLLWELWIHTRAEQAEAARAVAGELAGVMVRVMGR
jgi:hypothetical protein